MDYELKRKFEELYICSLPENRSLFDNPETRSQVPQLDSAYRAYRATDKRKKKRGLRINWKNEITSSAVREMNLFCWGLEFFAGTLEYGFSKQNDSKNAEIPKRLV